MLFFRKAEIVMNTKVKVLIIEDDKNVLAYIAAALSSEGYRTVSALTGTEGLCLAASHCPHVILLDLGLPDIDGYQVLKQLRSWSQIPIIIISARTGEETKITALDLGADDYLTKPFGIGELIARIRTSLRRVSRITSVQTYKALNLEINFDKHIIRLYDQIIHLTQIEYQLLELLAKNSGKVLTYRHIMNIIWGPYTGGSNQILRVNMANIRRKIEADPAQPQYVFTEIGIGYRMRENEYL